MNPSVLVNAAADTMPANFAAAADAPPGSESDIASRIERIPFCSWHIKTRLTIGMATFFEGFNILSISYVLPVLVPRWHLTPPQTGALIGVGFLGGAISTFALGWIAERFGRKTAIVLSTAAYSVASLLGAFAWNFASMFVLRGLQGLGGGGEAPVAVTYISELSRAKGRGRFILMYEIIFPLGLLAAAVAGWWLVGHVAWQLMFVIGGLPALVVLYLQRRIPESPRWLAAQGRRAEAAAVMDLIERESEKAIGAPLPPALPIAVAPISLSFTRDLFGPVYLRRTLMAWAICFTCYIMNFGIVGWLPTLYQGQFHLSVDRSLSYSLVTTTAGLAGTVLCAFLIDIVGRRTWFALAFAASAAVMMWIWQGNTSSPEFLMIVGSIGYFFISTISIGIFLYLPEIFPTRLRARAVSIASVWTTVAGIVGPGCIGLVLASWGLAGVFLGLGFVGVVGMLIAALFAVETRGRVLEEVSP
jgi:putative MFS transporter